MNFDSTPPTSEVTMAAKKPMTEKQDAARDKKAGIKEGSKKDMAADKKAGLPFDMKGAPTKRK
jgi:hypothetical protein